MVSGKRLAASVSIVAHNKPSRPIAQEHDRVYPRPMSKSACFLPSEESSPYVHFAPRGRVTAYHSSPENHTTSLDLTPPIKVNPCPFDTPAERNYEI